MFHYNSHSNLNNIYGRDDTGMQSIQSVVYSVPTYIFGIKATDNTDARDETHRISLLAATLCLQCEQTEINA